MTLPRTLGPRTLGPRTPGPRTPGPITLGLTLYGRHAAWLLGLLLLAAPPAPALGQAQRAGMLDDPTAFERGFAISLYQFDACGDALAGRMFRRALAERLAQCPFTPAARAQYRERTGAEFAKARRQIAGMIEANGGLPRELSGMTRTCHAQQASAEYRAFRALLERHAEGSVGAEAVIPAACDAADILP